MRSVAAARGSREAERRLARDGATNQYPVVGRVPGHARSNAPRIALRVVVRILIAICVMGLWGGGRICVRL